MIWNDLHGPAREITVEPLTVPEPVEVPQEAPAPPRPVEEPVPA
jgi:hypothetical protein